MLGTADTIVAIATAPGEGGVGIVRLSGPRSLEIGGLIVRRPRERRTWTSHYLCYGHVFDAETGRQIDEVLAVYMASPRTFTAEDVFEIHCHGGAVPLRAVVMLAVQAGARPAERGEFTLRAFLNGRIDLSQAEAVLDIVRARTPTALHMAADRLAGGLSRRLNPVIEELVGLLAFLEASIDFVEEGIPQETQERLAVRVERARQELDLLLSTAADGIVLRQGVRAVLVGTPNVGKSSLLNLMLRTERAIVTAIAGTTRDTVEEPAVIGDIPVYLVDTAGLRETTDPVELLGVRRSRQAIADADLLLLLADGSRTFGTEDREAFAAARELAPETPIILVLNKRDLPQEPVEDDAKRACGRTGGENGPRAVVHLSATSGDGLPLLEEAIARVALEGEGLKPEETMIATERHKHALDVAVQALETAVEGLRLTAAPLDLLCSDVRMAVDSLGTITGQDMSESLLDRIFSDFCLGK